MTMTKEEKDLIANYQQQIKDFRRLKSDHQLQVKMCDKNIKTLQTRLANLKARIKSCR